MKQFYAPRLFFISFLLSIGIGNTVNGQTVVMYNENTTTLGDGSAGNAGDILYYRITTTNNTSSNLSNSTIYGRIPEGTTYVAGSTTVNGVAVSDVNGKMPFTGSGGLINSSSSSEGVVAPNASVKIEYYVQIGGNLGTVSNSASLQATNSSGGSVIVNSNTISTTLSGSPYCSVVFESTTMVANPPATYKYSYIKTMNTSNGTVVQTIYSGSSGICYSSTGASLGYGTILKDAQAIALDANDFSSTLRVYFINGTTNNPAQDLCYIDPNYNNTGTVAAVRFENTPLETNTGAGYNINRMTFGSDNNGYALTANGLDLIKFHVDRTTNTATITPLGTLLNDANNGSNDVLAETGGDLFADGSGYLYLIPNSGKLYRINPSTNITTYLGTISNMPPTVNSVAAVANGVLIGGPYQSVYKVDLATMKATVISSGTTNVWQNADYASCIMPVLAPVLNATKTFVDLFSGSDSMVISNDPVQYTIVVHNTGNVGVNGAKLYDALSAYSRYQANTTTMNGVAVADISGAMPFSVTGGQLINSSGESAGVIKAGDSAIIKFTVKTNQALNLCNQANITYPDIYNNQVLVLSDDPRKPGTQDSTCFFSDSSRLGNRVITIAGTPKNDQSLLPASVKVQPNPFINELNLQVQSNTAEQVQIRLIDFYGRAVYTTKEKLGAGYNFLHLTVPANLAAGIYVLELSAGNNRLLQKKLIKQ